MLPAAFCPLPVRASTLHQRPERALPRAPAAEPASARARGGAERSGAGAPGAEAAACGLQPGKEPCCPFPPHPGLGVAAWPWRRCPPACRPPFPCLEPPPRALLGVEQGGPLPARSPLACSRLALRPGLALLPAPGFGDTLPPSAPRGRSRGELLEQPGAGLPSQAEGPAPPPSPKASCPALPPRKALAGSGQTALGALIPSTLPGLVSLPFNS